MATTLMASARSSQVPLLVLGGAENTLAIVRSLGKRGIPVSVSALPNCPAFASRYCHAKFVLRPDRAPTESWTELLLGYSHHLQGSVLLACSDDGVEFLARKHGELTKNYLLDTNVPRLQLELLDKERSLHHAKAAGIPVPRYWEIQALDDVERLKEKLEFPVILKPVYSHHFQRYYNKKFLRANSTHEVMKGAAELMDRGLRFVVSEMIPGPDDRLGSYYTYIDRDGQNLFRFTKRIIRRSPKNEGGGSYHITEWDDQIADLGERFFRAIGFRGLGNVEFKRDPRDARLKFIECNPRFTAVQELLVRSGVDSAYIVYCSLTGQPPPVIDGYRERVRCWYPVNDFDAFRQLRSMGELSLPQWIKSIAHRQVLPHFQVSDPWPAVIVALRVLRLRIGWLWSKWTRLESRPSS